MARNGVKSGGRNIKKGEVLNPSGIRKGTKIAANDFKDWAFSVWKQNKAVLKETILSDDANAMKFLQLLASFVPKEVDLGNKDDKPLLVKWTE